MNHVVITGASTGIGYATAEELVQRGYHVFGSVRTAADADRLQRALGARFTPLLFDITDQAAIQQAAVQVQRLTGAAGLAGLVNNAGIAVAGPLLHLPVDELRRQFDVNLFGLVAITQVFLPLLGATRNSQHPPGRIVNISSISGRIAFPFLGPYAASKHALEALSDSLRRELLIYGIDVIVIQPGTVRTPIWEKAANEDSHRFATTDYAPVLARLQTTTSEAGRKGMPPERVATVIRLALEHPHPRTRYTLPGNWLLSWVLPRWLSDRWLDRIIAYRLGLRKA